jgi:hypothetical protein
MTSYYALERVRGKTALESALEALGTTATRQIVPYFEDGEDRYLMISPDPSRGA